MQAGEIVGSIYEALLKQYDDNSPEALRWLNILCVRIVFCLYAEDAGIFTHDQFHDFLARYEAEVPMTPYEKRALRKWVTSGHSPYENTGSKYLCISSDAPYDFLDIYRMDRELEKETKGMTDAEKKAYLMEYMGWTDESDQESSSDLIPLNEDIPF